MAYSGAGTAVPSITEANTYAASQNAVSLGPPRRFRLIADCPSPSAQGRSGVRIRMFTRVIGPTMPDRCLRHITRACNPPQPARVARGAGRRPKWRTTQPCDADLLDRAAGWAEIAR